MVLAKPPASQHVFADPKCLSLGPKFFPPGCTWQTGWSWFISCSHQPNPFSSPLQIPLLLSSHANMQIPSSSLAAVALLTLISTSLVCNGRPNTNRLPRRPLKKVWLTGWRNYTNIEEVKAAPVSLARRPRQGVYVVPPKLEGRCVISPKSKRQVCYPDPTLLDTSCSYVQVVGDHIIESISPPQIENGRLKSVDQVVWPVRLRHRHPRLRPHVSATYVCNVGFKFLDEAESMFCRNRRWIYTTPKCVPDRSDSEEDFVHAVPVDYVAE